MAFQSPKRYVFETVTFKQKTATLPPRSTVGDAKVSLAPELQCSPADLHIFYNGREYADGEAIPEPDAYNPKKYPVVYRHVALGASAAPAPAARDPDDFQEIVAGLRAAADDKVDQAVIERMLREAHYDPDVVLEPLLQLAQAPGVPADVRRQLAEAKPAHMTVEEAIALYNDACDQNLEDALAILRACYTVVGRNRV
jgi:hypothetical protein